MKTCTACKINLDISKFAPHAHFKDGFNPRCKNCIIEAGKSRRDRSIEIPEGSKYCTRCKEIKSLSEFFKSNRSKDGFYWTCRTCTNEVNGIWASKNQKDAKRIASGAARRAHVRRKYNLTDAEYKELVVAGKGLCSACKSPEIITHKNGKVWELCVDHDHVTGKVRGLLCHACNRAAGAINDDPARLRQIADYLEERRLL
jgi:hypothetical protein